jgi:signal peptide peptidase SppA
MSDHEPITRDETVEWLSQPHTWALLPQTLAIITAVARDKLRVEAGVRRATTRAALREQAPEPTGNVIAVLGIRGLITPRGTWLDELCGGGGGLVQFQAGLAEAVDDDGVTAILLDIDSPGGLADLVTETAAMIREARDEKPVMAIANTMAASAAYWLGAQADELVITPSGVAGSIGVYAAHEDWSGNLEQNGVVMTLVSAGRHKTDGNPWEPLTEEARAGMQEIVDDVYDQFVADVALGRGASEVAIRSGYGQGRVLTAERALAAGLVDRVETVDEALERLVAETPVSAQTRANAGAASVLSSTTSTSSGGTAVVEPTTADEPDPEPVAAESADDPEAAEAAAREARERLVSLL